MCVRVYIIYIYVYNVVNSYVIYTPYYIVPCECVRTFAYHYDDTGTRARRCYVRNERDANDWSVPRRREGGIFKDVIIIVVVDPSGFFYSSPSTRVDDPRNRRVSLAPEEPTKVGKKNAKFFPVN